MLYEFKDLSPEIQIKVKEKFINEEIETSLEQLNWELSEDRITEEGYYEILGCSNSYAETTSWFVPACYYEKHKEEIDKEVKENLEKSLFTHNGVFIQMNNI
jgi:tRNA A22 N-methylase